MFGACSGDTLTLTDLHLCLRQQGVVSLRPSETVLVRSDLEDGRKYGDGNVGSDPDRGSLRKHSVHDQHERKNEDHRPVYARPQVQATKHRIQTKRRDLEGQTIYFYLTL